MVTPWLKCFAFCVLIYVTGCAGTEVISGEPYTERDLIVDLAYEYLIASGEINPKFHAVPQVSIHVGRPCYGCPRGESAKRWVVSFELFDAFGESVGYASTSVMRHTSVGEPRYEVGT